MLDLGSIPWAGAIPSHYEGRIAVGSCDKRIARTQAETELLILESLIARFPDMNYSFHNAIRLP